MSIDTCTALVRLLGQFWSQTHMQVCVPLGFLKTLTPIHQNPYPLVQVWVCMGKSTGCPGIPQGYSCQSLLERWRNGIYNERAHSVQGTLISNFYLPFFIFLKPWSMMAGSNESRKNRLEASDLISSGVLICVVTCQSIAAGTGLLRVG